MPSHDWIANDRACSGLNAGQNPPLPDWPPELDFCTKPICKAERSDETFEGSARSNSLPSLATVVI